MTAPRPDRKRKGSPEWVRLGEQLADRRADLSPDYEGHGGRAAFARERDVNLKLIQDIELNARENFTPKTLRDVIAPAYGVTYESIRRSLEEGGSLEPAPEDTPRPALHAAPEVPPDDQEASADVIAFARTMGIDPDDPADAWLRPVRQEIADAIMTYGAGASGKQIFHGQPASRIEAQIWDDRRASRQSKELFIAAMRANRAAYEDGHGNGVSRIGLAPPVASGVT